MTALISTPDAAIAHLDIARNSSTAKRLRHAAKLHLTSAPTPAGPRPLVLADGEIHLPHDPPPVWGDTITDGPVIVADTLDALLDSPPPNTIWVESPTVLPSLLPWTDRTIVVVEHSSRHSTAWARAIDAIVTAGGIIRWTSEPRTRWTDPTAWADSAPAGLQPLGCGTLAIDTHRHAVVRERRVGIDLHVEEIIDWTAEIETIIDRRHPTQGVVGQEMHIIVRHSLSGRPVDVEMIIPSDDWHHPDRWPWPALLAGRVRYPATDSVAREVMPALGRLGERRSQTVLTQPGWYNGVYVCGDTAIGPDGETTGYLSDVAPHWTLGRLGRPTADVIADYAAGMMLTDPWLALTLACVGRAPMTLDTPGTVVIITGPSGSGKTAWQHTLQCHSAAMPGLQLPVSVMQSTPLALLEAVASTASGDVICLDDVNDSGGDRDRALISVEKLVGAVFDRQGRRRLDRSGRARPTPTPDSVVVLSAERDILANESRSNRATVIPFRRDGWLRRPYSDHAAWVAGDGGEVMRELRAHWIQHLARSGHGLTAAEIATLRSQIEERAGHARLVDASIGLVAGLIGITRWINGARPGTYDEPALLAALLDLLSGHWTDIAESGGDVQRALDRLTAALQSGSFGVDGLPSALAAIPDAARHALGVRVETPHVSPIKGRIPIGRVVERTDGHLTLAITRSGVEALCAHPGGIMRRQDVGVLTTGLTAWLQRRSVPWPDAGAWKIRIGSHQPRVPVLVPLSYLFDDGGPSYVGCRRPVDDVIASADLTTIDLIFAAGDRDTPDPEVTVWWAHSAIEVVAGSVSTTHPGGMEVAAAIATALHRDGYTVALHPQFV